MGSGSSIASIFKPVVTNTAGLLGLNGFTGWRDSAEAAAELAGNYYLPGSSIVTHGITSRGAQEQLDSPIGRVANVGTGLAGAGAGQGFTGIPSAAEAGGGWGNLLSSAGNATGLTGEGSVLGTTAGTPLENGAGPTQGSGILGGASKGISSLSSALSTGSGGGSSSYGTAASLLGAANSLSANDQAQKDLLDAENKSLGQLSPYLTSGAAANSRLSDLLGTSTNTGSADFGALSKAYTPADLQNDPGYKFELEQGNKALDRQQAAKGGYFSGAALKAAQDYGTGLADQTYKDAYARDLANKQNLYNEYAGQSAAGQNAATSAGTLYENTGNAKANAGISSANTINQTLSSLLTGSGAKRPINVGGQVYYI